MNYLNSMSVTISNDDLKNVRIIYFPELSEKYCLMIGEIAMFFSSYTDLKRYCLGVQSEFEKTLSRATAILEGV